MRTIHTGPNPSSASKASPQAFLSSLKMKPLNTPITSWAGKRIWLVGASSGIGAALAQGLLQAGASVVVSARRGDQLAIVAAPYANASVLPFDVTDTEAWPLALATVLERLGQIDLVVMGAARYDPTHSWQIDIEQAQKSFDLNVVSVYRGLSVIVPQLLEQGHGGISLIGSISGYTGLPRALIYGATKAALQKDFLRGTAALERELVPDHRMSVLLGRALKHGWGARGSVRVAGATDWTRRNFGRWLFEDEPRAVVL